MHTWIILSPLLAGLALVGYGIWQLVKEIKPSLNQIKSLQEELDRAKQAVTSSIPEMQELALKAREEAENGRALVLESKEAFANIKAIVGVVRAFDTTPVRQGIAYVRYKRDERRLRKLPEKAKSWIGKALDSAEKAFRAAKRAV